MRCGNLFVISGPSGAGKGTLVARLLREVPDAWLSISATTRKPRNGEKDGVHYYFCSRDDFEKLICEDGFLEWATYAGNNYGTPRKSVESRMAQGAQVILEIDVQGAFQIREKVPSAKLVFIEPPSLAVLEERLRGRNTESDEVIARRMQEAKRELSCAERYDKRIVNDNLDMAVRELVSYVNEQAEIS